MLRYTNKQSKYIIDQLECEEELYSFRFKGYSLYFIFRVQIESILYIPKNKEGENISILSRDTNLTAGIKFYRRAINQTKIFIKNRLFKKQIENTNNNDFLINNEITIISNYFTLSKKVINKKEYFDYYKIIKYFNEHNHIVNYILFSTSSSIPLLDCKAAIINMTNINYVNTVNEEDKEILRSFIKYISTKLNVDFHFYYKDFLHLMININSQVDYLYIALKDLNVPYLFGMSCYCEPWQLMVADKLNIPFIELQHGPIISHLIHFNSKINYDKKERKLLFPDYILLKGEKWKKILIGYDYIWNEDNCLVIGSEAFDRYEKSMHVNNRLTNILFTTQPGLFSIFSLIDEFLNLFEKKLNGKSKVFIRPHPSENQRKWEIFKNKHKGVTLLDYNSEHFYESLVGKDIVIGASSTTLYEALAFGKRVLIPKTWEDYNEPGVFETFENSEDLFNKITSENRYSDSAENEFLSPFNGKVLDRFLKPKPVLE